MIEKKPYTQIFDDLLGEASPPESSQKTLRDRFSVEEKRPEIEARTAEMTSNLDREKLEKVAKNLVRPVDVLLNFLDMPAIFVEVEGDHNARRDFLNDLEKQLGEQFRELMKNNQVRANTLGNVFNNVSFINNWLAANQEKHQRIRTAYMKVEEVYAKMGVRVLGSRSNSQVESELNHQPYQTITDPKTQLEIAQFFENGVITVLEEFEAALNVMSSPEEK